MDQIIGAVTTYTGDEHPYLTGLTVRIVAVVKGAAAPGADPDGDYPYVRDDELLADLGGVAADDLIVVTPWIPERGRWSFVTSDVRAAELELFQHLAWRPPTPR